MYKVIFSAYKKAGHITVVKEFEDKVGAFYGTEITLVTIAFDALFCTFERDLDNVKIFLEPKENCE